LDLTRPGIDGQEFSLVLDTNEFSKNSIIAVGGRQYGRRLYVIKDPQPYNRGYLYSFTLVSENPMTDFLPSVFLKIGIELELIDGSIGEFDQDLLGLPRLAERITMFESLGSGYGFEHKITDWADAKMLRNANGQPLDIMVYAKSVNGEIGTSRNDLKWEPFVEYLMRKSMLEMKVNRMIWGQPGTVKTNGGKQELKRTSAGVYHRMRNNGNLVQYNRGEFSANLLRSVFGDLFYRRVRVADRRVKIYTNEAGFNTFQQAMKEDALNSGLTYFAEVNAADTANATMASPQNHLTYGFAFDSMVSRETGRVELVHLQELDLPQTNLEYGQNKLSTPVFMVFDVSPQGDGTLLNNIREVRMASRPSMTWGYIDGTIHHLGFARSQGMSSANKFPGYELWMKDRSDVFIEDLSRTVLIEEIPQF